MKIAISGKGGVGKTTLAGSWRGYSRATAIRCSPSTPTRREPCKRRRHPRGGAKEPQAPGQNEGADRGAHRRDQGRLWRVFQAEPQVEDLPTGFSLNRDGVKLMVLGTIPQGGGGCFCPENVVLKSLLATFSSRGKSTSSSIWKRASSTSGAGRRHTWTP